MDVEITDTLMTHFTRAFIQVISYDSVINNTKNGRSLAISFAFQAHAHLCKPGRQIAKIKA